jgi:hypothetical protein
LLHYYITPTPSLPRQGGGGNGHTAVCPYAERGREKIHGWRTAVRPYDASEGRVKIGVRLDLLNNLFLPDQESGGFGRHRGRPYRLKRCVRGTHPTFSWKGVSTPTLPSPVDGEGETGTRQCAPTLKGGRKRFTAGAWPCAPTGFLDRLSFFVSSWVLDTVLFLG